MDTNYNVKSELNHKIPLLSSLKEYSEKDISCFDVPGHVRDRGVEVLNNYFGNDLMKMDINSSPFMDNVSNPYGIIKDAQDLLAKAYKAKNAFFVTNGTTGAIQAMLLSTVKPNDKILIPRNIHKSVINSLILTGAEPVFIQPEFNEEYGISMNIDYKKVEEILKEDKDIKALFLLNPTYYGLTSDLENIVRVCHENDTLVLVDEAHGAHFPFNLDLPKSSMMCGADMAAVSIHKTGGALTQASVLLTNNNIDEKKVLQSINMLQSTSASYLLMASIDGARYNLETNGEKQFSKALNLSRYTKSKLSKIDGIKILSKDILDDKGSYSIDETKICINVKDLNLTGFEVYELLYQEFKVQPELGDLYNLLILISIGTTKEDVDRLIKSLKIIAKVYRKKDKLQKIDIRQINPEVKMTPRAAFYSDKLSLSLNESIGKVSGESVMAYPPGIPIVAPGEVITKDIIDYINTLKNNNAYLTDMEDKDLQNILVVNMEDKKCN